MAGRRYLREEEIVSILENDDDILSEFSFGESASENLQDSDNEDSDSNSDTTDSDDSDVTRVPAATASSASEWRNVSDADPGPSNTHHIHNIDHGPVLPSTFDCSTEPDEYFHLFFDEDLLNLIVTETNIYGNKKLNTQTPPTKRARMAAWKECTVTDMKAIIGTIINMGLHPLTDITDYFSTSWVTRIPFFSDVFTRDEFLLLFWNLHFTHVERKDDPSKDRLIKPIVDVIREKCKLHYNPQHPVSVDESTISFKGKISFKTYNPKKPTKFGMKVFVLSDSTNGYVYDFQPYTGKGTVPESEILLKTTQIVKNLCSSLIKDTVNPPIGYHIYTDRYYTSPQLADELKNMKMLTTGTVMTNRRGLPNEIKKGAGKKLTKGDVLSYRKGDQLVLSWKDKRVVTMLSTKHKGSKHEMTSVPSKHPNRPPTMKPNVVVDYTKHMGGVDRSDHLIASYQFMRRTKKWYRKVFFWMLEVSIINSYLLYLSVQESHHKKPLTHKQFRQRLVLSLVKDKVTLSGRLERQKPGRPVQGPPEERLTGRHFMRRKEKGKGRCVVCMSRGERKETIYFCNSCARKPYLHPDTCFETYHTCRNY